MFELEDGVAESAKQWPGAGRRRRDGRRLWRPPDRCAGQCAGFGVVRGGYRGGRSAAPHAIVIPKVNSREDILQAAADIAAAGAVPHPALGYDRDARAIFDIEKIASAATTASALMSSCLGPMTLPSRPRASYAWPPGIAVMAVRRRARGAGPRH